MSTFVSVGNAKQPFNRLIETVVQWSHDLPQPVFVQYGHSNGNLGKCHGIAFLDMDEFRKRMSQAEVVIIHAGAGSVIHALSSGKVPVVMARQTGFDEHVDNHQVEFADEFESTGKIVVCKDPDQLPDAVKEAIQRQRNVKLNQQRPQIVELVRNAILSGN